ncbi:kelch-like protein 24 isoform X2 [Lycorma delicatula]|uniref:kelch-like protein 24 isoform X2 n=1 Tax=Lycorma delicatula TaxID=130591 RepID=UPI003F5122A0
MLGLGHVAMNAAEKNVPSNRLPYNSRQRQPSTDSDSSTTSDNNRSMDGPGANEYKFTENTHSNEILQGLNDLRKNGQFCDVTLSVDGVKFLAHRNVLSSFSPYFKAMFLSKLAESKQNVVQLKGVEVDMMSLLLDYAYTSSIVITRSNVQALLSAANLLQVLPVRDAACLFLERHMDASNCLGIHCFAEQHACTDLQNKAKDYALQNFLEVCHHEEFLGLLPAKLVELTSSDNLQVDKEESVFQAVARWYNDKPEIRRPDFYKVLETVRLPLLSPYFLHDCVENMPVVKQNPDCCQLVEEAKLYHLLPDRRAELSTSRTKQRNSADTIEVIVAVGGEDDKVVLRSVEYYCTKTNTWRTLACLPFAVSKHGLVASGKNTLYLAGGEFPDGSASRTVWRYDPVLDFWQEMASMIVPRSELGLAMLDGCVYAVGGWDGAYRLESVERYDPSTNSWSMIEPMKMAITSPAVIAHDGMLYVTGGAVLEDGDGIELVQRYNPRTDTWNELSPMLIPRSGAATCVLNGQIFVVGGWHASTENTNRVECYNVQSDTWEFKAPMCERRYRPGIAVMEGKIYVLGGEEGWDRYHDTIECYEPETDSWKITGEMPTSRSWLSCVPLQVKKSLCREKS